MPIIKILISICMVLGSTAYAEESSHFTSLTTPGCVVTEQGSDPIDFMTLNCGSWAGYQISITGSDLRYSPRLQWQGHEIHLPVPIFIHDVESFSSETYKPSVEWYYPEMTAEKPTAAIYTLFVENDPLENDSLEGLAEMDPSALTYTFHQVVVKLAGKDSCFIGTVKNDASGIKARKIAANTSRPCIDTNNHPFD